MSRTRTGRAILPVILLLVSALCASADSANETIYQGYLSDPAGQPLAGTVSIEIGVWDAPAAGARLYHESHSSVPLEQGLFNLVIGAGTVLEGAYGVSTFDGSARYLEVVVNGETLQPRRPIGAAPYALSSGASDRRSLTGYAAWSKVVQHIRTSSGTPVASNRIMTYEKKLDDSILKLTYTDNLRAYNYSSNSEAAACKFHVYVDGEPCSVPAPITGAVYTAYPAHTNPHHIRTMVGVCSATASGPLTSGNHEVRVYVQNHFAGRDMGCYLGWESTATLLVEELP